MTVTQFGQTFYEEEANRAFPDGCQCGNNGGGDCEWCHVYYGENVIFDCVCCGGAINPEQDQFVKISRGYFGPFERNEGFDRANENVKFERFLCEKCFLMDPDLCEFFNKLGLRVR